MMVVSQQMDHGRRINYRRLEIIRIGKGNGHTDAPALAREAMDRLMAYDWPGNVRELENLVERALILSQGAPLTFDDLSGRTEEDSPSLPGAYANKTLNLDAVISNHIRRVLEMANGRVHGKGGAAGIRGTVELFLEFANGLKDLDGFSHLTLLYLFNESSGYKLTVTPFLDSEPRGLFATRAPKRPNPIGLSIVILTRIRGWSLEVENVDILDATPLLDIKPYVPEFDHQENWRIGWLEQAKGAVQEKRSDSRFERHD